MPFLPAKRAFCTFLLFLLLVAPVSPAGELAQRSAALSVRFRMDFSSKTIKGRMPKAIIAAVPVPEINAYQDIDIISTGDGRIERIYETDDRYMVYRKLIGSGEKGQKHILRMHWEARVTLYDVSCDFSLADHIYPMHEYGREYGQYIRRVDPYVMPDHVELRRVADQIRRDLGAKGGNPLEFAREAFEYVVRNFSLAEETEFGRMRTLEKTLKAKSGNSCELVNVFLSLLRSQKIPGRHLVGVLCTGKPHVASEFFMQEYGWIPVDVALQLRHPERNFFGIVDADLAPIILNRDLELTVAVPVHGREKLPIFQKYLRLTELARGTELADRYVFTLQANDGGGDEALPNQ